MFIVNFVMMNDNSLDYYLLVFLGAFGGTLLALNYYNAIRYKSNIEDMMIAMKKDIQEIIINQKKILDELKELKKNFN